MRVNDVVIGSILLVGSVSAAIYASDFPSVPRRDFGAWTFPMVISVMLALSSAFLIYQGATAGAEQRQRSRPSGTAIANILMICLAPIFYVIAVPVAGFIPAVILIISVITYRLWGGLLRSVALAVVATLAVDAIFRGVMGVPLPIGIVPWTPW